MAFLNEGTGAEKKFVSFERSSSPLKLATLKQGNRDSASVFGAIDQEIQACQGAL